jgi:hypothetical protein
MEEIAISTDHRLADTLALQAFAFRHHFMRRALLLAVCMLGGLVIATMMNGAPFSDSLEDLSRNLGSYAMLFVVGLVLIQAMAFALGMLAWLRRPKPREIRATVNANGLTMQKDGFSLAARWADADLVTESRAAYLLKFNQLYMRLPKRGFSPEQEAAFRAFAGAAPLAANRLGS